MLGPELTDGRNPWETTTKRALVDICTHSLHISTSGPARLDSEEPVVIFFTGGGLPCISHVRLQRLLSSFVRVYFPDRAGYDLSERSPAKLLTATVSAEELYAQMQKIDVQPPYVLVGHSYGCIIAREFLHLCNEKWLEAGNATVPKPIAGMVLVEAATELMYVIHAQYPSSSLQAITRELDFERITHLREESQLTDTEWFDSVSAKKRTEPGAALEDYRLSGQQLAAKQQFRYAALGDAPLSVIRCNFAGDYERMLKEGIKKGNGTEEERREAQEFVDTVALWDDELRAAQLRLSKAAPERVRYVYEGSVGHDVILRTPEVVVNEVKALLDMGCGQMIASSEGDSIIYTPQGSEDCGEEETNDPYFLVKSQ